jgi:hypothetical protein
MRIRILWLPIGRGLVDGLFFPVALWLPRCPQLSSDRGARAGPPAGRPSPAWSYPWR